MLKIIIEVIVGIILLMLGAGFWNCFWSPKRFRALLGNYEELKKFYNFLGKDRIEEECKLIEPVFFSDVAIGYSGNIYLCLNSSLAALDKVRNLSFIAIIVLLVISFFLGKIYVIINLVILLIMAFPKISWVPSATNNLLSDIRTLILNVYKWNQVNHSECESFCLNEKPNILKNIYRVITEE